MPNRRASPLHMVLAALFCALAAVLAQIQIPLPAVPISLTTLAAYLCGALLPPRYAAGSMLCYALLGAVGVPVYAGFVSGPAILFGPSGGFIFGFALCAWLTALILRRIGAAPRARVAAMAAGTAACYALGTVWFIAVTGTGISGALLTCVVPFLPGDAVKILLSAHLAGRLHRALHL